MPVEEGVDLGGLLAEEAGGEAVLGVVREREGLVQGADSGQADEGHEELVAEERVVLGKAVDHGRGHEVAVGEVALAQETGARASTRPSRRATAAARS